MHQEVLDKTLVHWTTLFPMWFSNEREGFEALAQLLKKVNLSATSGLSW